MTQNNFDKIDFPDKPQSILYHMTELRKRLIYTISVFFIAFGISFSIKEKIFSLLAVPLTDLISNTDNQFIYTSLSETFTTYLKLSFITAFAITIPMILIQSWLFISPALYKNEKKLTGLILFISPILFIIGALFAYKFIIPNAWKFFLQFENSTVLAGVPLKLQAKISRYLTLTSQIILSFGLCFQLPLIVILLGKIGLVKSKNLLKGRKYSLLLIMIISAFLTPPDIISMLGLTIPLYILYELSAQILRFIEISKKNKNN